MIKITINKSGDLEVVQRCLSPTVYLDHWAWRKISESEATAKRFSSALKWRNGTLALSWLNLVEFSKVTDEQQAGRADVLLDEILPRGFFLNPDFFKVISEEDKLLADGEPAEPHADSVFLKFFVKHNLSKPKALKLLPAQNIFRLVRATGIATRYDGFANLVINRIESLRQDYDNKREFYLAVKRIPKGPPIQRGTRFVARELLGSLLMDKHVKVDRKHAIDVCHAVVPVTYCDYVLLDRHWETQVGKAQKRIRAGSLTFPIAKVFSERANGIERFLQELQSDRTRANR